LVDGRGNILKQLGDEQSRKIFMPTMKEDKTVEMGSSELGIPLGTAS